MQNTARVWFLFARPQGKKELQSTDWYAEKELFKSFEKQSVHLYALS